jgi:hypothetical protein
MLARIAARTKLLASRLGEASLVLRPHLTARHAAADAAKIDKRVSMHTLRQYPASGTTPSQVGWARNA